MIELILNGVCGRMGQAIIHSIEQRDDFHLLYSVDEKSSSIKDLKVHEHFPDSGVSKRKNIILIDFSSPKGMITSLEFAQTNEIPFLSGTTGLESIHLEKLQLASTEIPVFYSANMSFGIAVLSYLLENCAKLLHGKADIEIVEYHHSCKVDAPSGTAIMLADIIKSIQDDVQYSFGRYGKTGPRKKNEIGLHSIRGGGIIGRHDILFGLQDETITLSHSAISRQLFANGALEAAIFLVNKQAGLYDMHSIISQRIKEVK